MPKISNFNSFTLCGSKSSFIVHRNTQEGGKLLKIKNAVSFALIEAHTQKYVKRSTIRNIARKEMQNLGIGNAGLRGGEGDRGSSKEYFFLLSLILDD